MNKSAALILATLSVFAAGESMAQSISSHTSVQVAVANTGGSVMTHEVATLMQKTREADAQYRRSGLALDKAYAQSLRAELANKGFGRTTVTVPVGNSNATELAQTPVTTLAR